MNLLQSICKRQFPLPNLYTFSSVVIGSYSERVFNVCSKKTSVRLFTDKKLLSLKASSPGLEFNRLKYKHTRKDEDSDEDDSDDDDDDGNSKLIIGHVISLRADAVLKAGLGMARNKIETCFYESKIRVNGRKIQKKSQKVNVGDEIDVIKGKSPMNESLLNISRIVLVSVKENEGSDRLKIKMKRFKDLAVDDYLEPWETKKKED